MLYIHKSCLKILTLIVFLFFDVCVNSQIIDKDTSDVVIRRTKKDVPTEYNISDVIIKLDKFQTKNVIRVDLDIPAKTTLSLSVSDTSGNTIIYLINDQTLKPGVYRVKWEMVFCRTGDCDYPPGRYLCAFETDQFVFTRDFYLK